MCMDSHVTISEELAEEMTLPKDYEDANYRLKLLDKIAECAFQQGSYHLATKKYTQAGNKTKVRIFYSIPICLILLICLWVFLFDEFVFIIIVTL